MTEVYEVEKRAENVNVGDSIQLFKDTQVVRVRAVYANPDNTDLGINGMVTIVTTGAWLILPRHVKIITLETA